MTTVIRTPSVSIEEIVTPHQVQPEQKPPFFGHSWKIRLLFILLGGLIALLLFQLLLTLPSAIKPAPTTCTGLMQTADYAQAVGLQTSNQTMDAVQMVNELDGGSPAALIQVTTNDAHNTLDVYIFGCTLQQKQPRLTRLFAEQGLIQGTVELTPNQTLMTAELDTKLPPSAVAFLQPLQQNVYHEYVWQEDHFAQVPFAGFYPVASKVEAQTLQQGFNNKESMPWNDPVATSLQMSKDLLQWNDAPQTRLVSQTATTALVELTAKNPRVVLDVTLKRLVQTNKSGLWFVTDARSPGTLLTQPGTLNQPLQAAVTSPLTFSGANLLTDGHTTVTLFDHTLTPLEQATNLPLTVRPDSTYVGSIPYSNLLRGQQGILCIQSLPLQQNASTETGQLVLTGVTLN